MAGAGDWQRNKTTRPAGKLVELADFGNEAALPPAKHLPAVLKCSKSRRHLVSLAADLLQSGSRRFTVISLLNGRLPIGPEAHGGRDPELSS